MPYLGVRPADITSATEAEVAGDLTVDTNTLKVDATNNRVFVGATSGDRKFEVHDTGVVVANFKSTGANSLMAFDNSSDTSQNHMIGFSGDDFRVVETTEKIRVLSSGGITFNGDTAQANSLDSYEQGTFTPTFSSGLTSPGYLSQIGTYVKVGAMVICSVYLRANSGTENSDHIRIGGLPFAFTSATDHAYGGFFTYNGAFWSSNTNVTWLGLSGNTTLGFYTSAGASIPGTNSNVAANLAAACRLTVVYRTDA